MRHPNKLPFMGILTFLDRPSDKAPTGARGHRVILTREAAQEAMDTLIGMGINFSDGKEHKAGSKQGIIESAEIIKDEILVYGYMWERDCQSVISCISAKANEYGMSYELADARVRDIRKSIWTLDKVTFTGAAIILKEKAAYTNTEFVLIES